MSGLGLNFFGGGTVSGSPQATQASAPTPLGRVSASEEADIRAQMREAAAKDEIERQKLYQQAALLSPDTTGRQVSEKRAQLKAALGCH